MRYLILTLSLLFVAITFAQNEAPVIETSYVEPEFVGGPNEKNSYLKANIEYPISAIMNGESGRVLVKFIIEIDGSVSNVEVLKSSGSEALDKEAMRVVKSIPKLKPVTKDGKTVRALARIPINFELATAE